MSDQFIYDAYNNIISVKDPRGNTTDYSYNALGQLTAEIYPEVDGLRYSKSYSYDYPLRKKTILNENGEKTVEYTDIKGNVLRREEYDGSTLSRTSYFYYDAAGNLVKEIDGKGGETVYTYDERNHLVSRIMPEAEFMDEGGAYTASPRFESGYNSDGYKISDTSYRNGSAILVEYQVNGLGQIISQISHYTDSDGTSGNAVIKSVFDKSGNEIERIDPRGNSTESSYTARGKLKSVTDALGNTLSYVYDKADRQISMTDPRGNSGNYSLDFTIDYKYDDLNRLIIGRLPMHQGLTEKPEVKLVYDNSGNLLYRIEPDGGITGSDYDARSRKISERRSASDSSSEYVSRMSYDGVGNLISLIEPGAGALNYEYDGLNRLVKEIYPDGGRHYYSYDKNDNLMFEDHLNGYRSYYSYNALNQRVKMIDQLNGISEYGYDESGNLSWYKDENGVVRESVYDELNRLVKETNGRGGESVYAYDESGNLVSVKDPRGTTITNIYSANNLLNSSSYSNVDDSHYVSYIYDEAGVLKSVSDGGIINSYNMEDGVYIPDPYGLIFNDNLSGAGEDRMISYSYDQKNRLTGLVLPSGESCGYEYNGLDQIVSVPGYIKGSIGYADNSYLESYTFLNDVSLNRSYDEKRRLTELEYRNENSGIILDEYRFSYDLSDNIIQKNGDYFSYDGKGRLISGSLVGASAGIESDYDGDSALMEVQPDILGTEKMIILSGSDLSLDWGAKSLGIDLGYGYRVSTIILKPATSETRLSEDSIEVYTSLYNMDGQYGEALEYDYSYDNETGEISLSLNDVSFARYIKIHSHFNEMDEYGNYLSSASDYSLDVDAPYTVKIMSAGRNEFYNYDKKDNRSKVSYVTSDFETNAYSYYENSDLIKRDGRYGYKYDANGNMVEKGSVYTDDGNDLEISMEDEYWLYEYDLLNRLTKVYKWDKDVNGGVGDTVLVKSYRYNASGYRVVSTDADGVSTYYSFDINGRMVEKSREESTRDYIYLGTKIIAHKEDGEIRYYGVDHLGSTVLMTDENGEAVWSGEVTPFADSEKTSDNEEHVLFTGKEFDPETGLYYFNARWYDPKTGRFTTEDPIRDGINWYSYCSNNPVNYTDPTGLDNETIISKYKMNDPKANYADVQINEAPLDVTIKDEGCAIALSANIDYSSGGSNDPGDINDKKDYVKNGDMQWAKFAADKGMDVERKDKPFTKDMYDAQGKDSSTSYYTGIKVSWNSDKKEHWVGVNGVNTDAEGNNFFIISPTSINDKYVGAGSDRGGVGWTINNNGDILVPENRVQGYVIFSKPKK